MNKTLYHSIIILGISGLAVSCNQEIKKPEGGIQPETVTNPATPVDDGTSDGAKLPAFQFEEETHDFGKITQGEKVTYNFKFKNSGSGDLLISNATASCGCTVPEYPKNPVPPGGEGIITVTFDSGGKEGKVSKTVTISSNTMPNVKVLTINAEILVPEKK